MPASNHIMSCYINEMDLVHRYCDKACHGIPTFLPSPNEAVHRKTRYFRLFCFSRAQQTRPQAREKKLNWSTLSSRFCGGLENDIGLNNCNQNPSHRLGFLTLFPEMTHCTWSMPHRAGWSPWISQKTHCSTAPFV